MEIILSEYKKVIHDSNELKLCNNSSFQLENVKLFDLLLIVELIY